MAGIAHQRIAMRGPVRKIVVRGFEPRNRTFQPNSMVPVAGFSQPPPFAIRKYLLCSLLHNYSLAGRIASR